MSLCHRELFEFSNHKKQLRLGIFSRLARSLATIYIFARVHIIGALVPFV